MYHLMSSDNPGGGLQGLKDRTIPRLLLLFIGALPQALKRIGVRGILWTKTWKILFLVYLLVMECARILEKRWNSPTRVDFKLGGAWNVDPRLDRRPAELQESPGAFWTCLRHRCRSRSCPRARLVNHRTTLTYTGSDANVAADLGWPLIFVLAFFTADNILNPSI